MADLTALDLLDQTAPRVSCGSLARKAALGRLDSVAAAVDEPPADAIGRRVRVDATAPTVPSGIGAPGCG